MEQKKKLKAKEGREISRRECIDSDLALAYEVTRLFIVQLLARPPACHCECEKSGARERQSLDPGACSPDGRLIDRKSPTWRKVSPLSWEGF